MPLEVYSAHVFNNSFGKVNLRGKWGVGGMKGSALRRTSAAQVDTWDRQMDGTQSMISLP